MTLLDRLLPLFPFQLPSDAGRIDLRNRHKLLIPLWVASLVAAKEKQCRAARVERIQHAQWRSSTLPRNSFMFAWREVVYHVGMRARQGGTTFLQQLNFGADFDLLISESELHQVFKLAGELDVPRHRNSIPLTEYSVKGILSSTMAGGRRSSASFSEKFTGNWREVLTEYAAGGTSGIRKPALTGWPWVYFF